MNILENIRFQQLIIENAKQQIDNSMIEIVDIINCLPNIKAHADGTHLDIKRIGTPQLSATISIEKYDSIDDLIKDITDWHPQNRQYALSEFHILQGLLLQLQHSQTSVRDQLQKIVDGYDNKNPQLSIEARNDGISITHHGHQLETYRFVDACDVTSYDELHKQVTYLLDKI